MRLSLVDHPDHEPLSLNEVKTHLKVETSVPDDDGLITSLITAARGHAERITGRALMTQTWRLKLDQFPRWRGPIEIPLPPLQSVTSVTYRDANDAPQTWTASNYVVDAPAGPYATDGRVYPAFQIEYPETVDRQDAVTVEFVAGYGTDDDVPIQLKQGLLLMIGHWYEHRESVSEVALSDIPQGAAFLLEPFQRWAAVTR